MAPVLPNRVATVSGVVVTEAALRIGCVLVLIARVLRVGRETGQSAAAGGSALVTGDDWDASSWDPEVMRDIDRRRRS
ncbi:hypothetical protein [Actinoplanes sp. NPDC049118]|uniref:hypothetical protein n=1 Tax=Actinoplanes sp. NPDC049118 TaxID=3155769 RepID=UPI00340E8D17